MANSSKDQNAKSSAFGVLNTNGLTPMRLYVNPTNGGLVVDDDTTGAYPGGNKAVIDDNSVRSMTGVSSVDGKTILKVLINSSNKLLIKST